MSYDISLTDPKTKETIRFGTPHQIKGGTYAMGGTTEAWLNVTWNYSFFFYNFLDKRRGIRWLYGKTGAEAIPRLEKAIKSLDVGLGSGVYEKDYWAPTPGNARQSLIGLLEFAKARPDGIFEGD